MADVVREFYDQLAGAYHLMFEDWEASMARQAAALGPILERECGPAAAVRVLDCACGPGTQTLGLARLGFQVTGVDLSAAAVERARLEASLRGLKARFYAEDMRRLNQIPDTGFDAVICMDNALPHLPGEDDLIRAAVGMRAKLRDGGTLLASIRDYDHLIVERPTVHGPAFLDDGGRAPHCPSAMGLDRRAPLHLPSVHHARNGRGMDHISRRIGVSCAAARRIG